MLRVMREHSQSLIIYLMFGVIIVVFAVNFGPGSGSCGVTQADYAAQVNGDVIRRSEFAQKYNRQLEFMRQTGAWGGGELTAEMADRLGLRKRVLDELVNQRLMAHEAQRRGLVVTDTELLERLEQAYGVKDVTFAQYEGWVGRIFQMTVAEFEEDVRMQVLADKMRALIEDVVTVTDTELKEQYRRQHDRAKVAFVQFAPSGTAVEAPSSAQVDDFLANKSDEAKAHYNDNLHKFRTSREIRARHILKTLPEDATDATVAKARGTLLELKTQLDGGADFASLAKDHSDDADTKDKGGDLGFLKRDDFHAPVTTKLFRLSAGAIDAEPVRSPAGLHLIQAVEIKEPAQRPFEEVQREVAEAILKKNAAKELAKKNADELFAALQAGKSFEDLTKTSASSINDDNKDDPRPVRAETPWIMKTHEAIPRIGLQPELRTDIFSMDDERKLAKQVYQVGDTYFVVMLTERETPDFDKFEEEKESLRRSAVWTKQSQVRQKWLEHLRENAKVDLNQALFPQRGDV